MCVCAHFLRKTPQEINAYTHHHPLLTQLHNKVCVLTICQELTITALPGNQKTNVAKQLFILFLSFISEELFNSTGTVVILNADFIDVHEISLKKHCILHCLL